MTGTIFIGETQAEGPHPAFPSCPVTLCHLCEAGECWLWLWGSSVLSHSDQVTKTKGHDRGHWSIARYLYPYYKPTIVVSYLCFNK